METVTTKKQSKLMERTKAVGTELTMEEYNKIQELINAGMYISISDFLRDAVRDKLYSNSNAAKVIEIRNVDYSEAKKEILDYYRRYKEAFPHEVAEALELDYELVWRITDDLKKEGRLEEIK
jgi:Arc/MetJ-type ribon-helix-helix transcriptional regulator